MNFEVDSNYAAFLLSLTILKKSLIRYIFLPSDLPDWYCILHKDIKNVFPGHPFYSRIRGTRETRAPTRRVAWKRRRKYLWLVWSIEFIRSDAPVSIFRIHNRNGSVVFCRLTGCIQISESL